jgi:hypothetical protein
MNRGNIILILSASLIIISCSQSKNPLHEKSINKDTVKIQPVYLTLTDAEKILGEKVHLTDSIYEYEDSVSEYKCSYTANAKDEKTGKTGVIYYLFQQFDNVTTAKNVYSFIKTANEDHEGVKVLSNIGDEAYYHSDGENFYFVMVRKGDKIFNMKVSKITGKTSLDDFNLTAINIASAL